MDSLTQLTAGAAVGQAVLGPRVGRRSMLWGAILGTLPDLDVFLPVDGPVEAFVSHRGFSHSLFLLALVSPLAGWLISRVHPDTRKHLKRWMLLAFLVLESSVLIDYLTVYGTQIFWPFDTTPRAWPIFFIIDPLFTLPLVAGCLAALLMTGNRRLGHRLNTAGLLLCLSYTVWAAGVREFTDHRVVSKLERQNVTWSRLTATPAPFTTLLHRYVGIDGDSLFRDLLLDLRRGYAALRHPFPEKPRTASRPGGAPAGGPTALVHPGVLRPGPGRGRDRGERPAHGV